MQVTLRSMSMVTILVMAALVSMTGAALQDKSTSGAELVSIVRLIATPEAYDGRRILVVGVAQIEFEQDLLYLSRADFENRVLPNAIRLSFAWKDPLRDGSLSGRYVGVEGVFRRKQPGTRSIQVGRLESISKVETDAPPPR